MIWENSTIYKAENLVGNNQLSLKTIKTLYGKWLKMLKFYINSNAGNSWYPSVVFYDSDFNMIEIHEEKIVCIIV